MSEKKYIIDNKDLMEEWDFEQNNKLSLDPQKLTYGSNKKVWWKCEHEHEWQATVYSRNIGRGCPYCSGKKVLKGFNDLQTINPSLAKEWNYEKNGNLKPENFTSSCGNKVWWKCKKGHEWQATINHRNNGRGCPVCNSERKTSIPEYALVYYLEKYGLDIIHSYKGNGYKLDIYIPSKKLAIEFDGYFWHKSRTKKDLEKNLKCRKDGVKLYRIRDRLPSLNDSSIDYIIQENKNDLSRVIKEILSEIIGRKIDINLEKDSIDIENLREYTEKEISLLNSNPNAAKEWNYEKNGNLKPESFFANSNKKVWWKCKNGHEYQATIINRNKGTGCPYCAGQKVLQGYNDLQTINPILSKEWRLKARNFYS